MANMLKLFRGTEEEISTALTAFFNRQGRIGNRVGNAKILTYEDGSIGVSVPYFGDVIDDGRQIDDIEDRKSFLLYRTSGTDTTPVDQFIKDHTDAGDDVSRPFVMTVKNDTLYFVAASKVVSVRDAWATGNGSDGNSDDVNDWTPTGTPTVASDKDDSEVSDDTDPFN